MCAGRFVHNRVEGKMLRHSCSLLRALQEYLVLASILRASRATQSQYLDRKIQGACIAPPTDRLELHPTQPPSHLPRQPISPAQKSSAASQRQSTSLPSLQRLRSTSLWLQVQ